MSEPTVADALAELIADTRALLQSQRLRGQQFDPGGELPPADASVEVAPLADDSSGGTLPPPDPSQAGLWAGLADQARKEAEARPTGQAGLDQIQSELGDCRRCGLCTGRSNIVFGVGDGEADLMVIGEAPGYHEDRRGEPFVGPAGEMLDKMLQHVIGVGRDQVYIANVVKCRPPNNRNPLPDEVSTCIPFLEAQIRAVQPKVMLVLGTVAFKSLFSTSAGITRSRGHWKEWGDIPVMPTFHPAYLLRKPEDKRLTFDDLKKVRTRYDELGGKH